jgi:hypothetical protein
MYKNLLTRANTQESTRKNERLRPILYENTPLLRKNGQTWTGTVGREKYRQDIEAHKRDKG